MATDRLVVLAAGEGSRLRSKARAKPLVDLAGLSLVERCIVAAQEAGFGEVVVVTGHAAAQVEDHVLEVSRRRGVPVRLVHNPRFQEGNGLSVVAARPVVGLDPFVLVMGDHVFSGSLLREMRAARVKPGHVLVGVDDRLGQEGTLDVDDAMKVRVRGGRIEAIGKCLTDYDAYDVGAFACSVGLFDAVELAASRGDSSLAAAIQVLADRGAADVLPIGDAHWFDVDTPADHRNGARRLFGAMGKPLDGAVAARLNRRLSQRVVTPLLLRLLPGVTPNQVTVLAFAAALAAATALALRQPLVGAALVVLASVLDGSDGEVARLTHRTSPYGAFLDPVLDRAADGLVFTGIAVYLATEPRLSDVLGSIQVPATVALAGLALVGHLLVSYTTAKALLVLGQRYRGRLVGGGRGRDLRLLILTLGAAAAPLSPVALLVSVAAVAGLTAWIVVVRLRASWWLAGPGAPFAGVRAVAFDFDGTVADSMAALTQLAVDLLVEEVGYDREEATRHYLITAGSDFSTQLGELAPGHPDRVELVARFEAAKAGAMAACPMFEDVGPTLDRLHRLGIPVFLCSSTRRSLVLDVCERHGQAERFTSIDGWAPGHAKTSQLAAAADGAGLECRQVVFVGDSRRDAEMAQSVSMRFVGLVRPDRPDQFAGSGAPVVASLLDLARLLARSVRSPAQPAPRGRGGRGNETAHVSPVPTAARRDPQSAEQTETLQAPHVVGHDQAPNVPLHLDGRDRATTHLDVPVALGPDAERPRHGVMGAHDRDEPVR